MNPSQNLIGLRRHLFHAFLPRLCECSSVTRVGAGTSVSLAANDALLPWLSYSILSATVPKHSMQVIMVIVYLIGRLV